MDNTILYIAGAHRSGTSMLTRLLHACGLYLGPESELMPAQADNPEGFWEHLGFVALNDELLNELGGAWDLPPKADESFANPQLDPLRLKAQILIEGFASASVWGWKDPRNSLTLPFWRDLLPELKTLIIVRNPLEVAYSMRERNGTSYSFGLRHWEIYNRRVIETAREQEQFVTHYDLFFENAERELRRIANFVGLPNAEVASAAALVTKRRRHTHFTIDQMIDARVSAELIELYRAMLAEIDRGVGVSKSKGNKEKIAAASQTAKQEEPDLLPGAVSRLNASVPERIAQIEHLERELLAQTEARHRAEIEKLSAHLAHTEAQHKSQVEEINSHLAETEARHKSQVEELKAHLAQTEEHYKAQIQEISAYYTREVKQLRDRVMQTSDVLRTRSISLAESETRGELLRNRLSQQLKVTKKLSRLLDEVDQAAAQLRSSARWQIANPIAALKAKLSPKQSRDLLGYGHLEKIVSTYEKWLAGHPEVAGIDDQIQSLISEATSSTTAQKVSPSATPSPAVSEPPVPTRSVEFPVHEDVEISIVIPVANQ